jgi:hypothetical protein
VDDAKHFTLSEWFQLVGRDAPYWGEAKYSNPYTEGYRLGYQMKPVCNPYTGNGESGFLWKCGWQDGMVKIAEDENISSITNNTAHPNR